MRHVPELIFWLALLAWAGRILWRNSNAGR